MSPPSAQPPPSLNRLHCSLCCSGTSEAAASEPPLRLSWRLQGENPASRLHWPHCWTPRLSLCIQLQHPLLQEAFLDSLYSPNPDPRGLGCLAVPTTQIRVQAQAKASHSSIVARCGREERGTGEEDTCCGSPRQEPIGLSCNLIFIEEKTEAQGA